MIFFKNGKFIGLWFEINECIYVEWKLVSMNLDYLLRKFDVFFLMFI